ncbi:hypothetical protein CEQ90_14325 [Lewinellaceae bacterium SD302]|nr:hypothetical protein CEQ90_14325 [Lewinellaceae bacterium SD302]
MRILALLFLLTGLLACGGESAASKTGNYLNETMTEAEAALGYSASSFGCLTEEGPSLCTFLDETLIRKYLGDDYEEMPYKATERGMLSTCSYQREDQDRMVTVKAGTMSMEVPATLTISLNGVREMKGDALSRFKNEYRTLTEKETERVQTEMKAALAEKVKRGEITEEQAEMAGSFGGAIGKARYAPVDGLGDHAVWGNALPDREPESSGSLYVLSGNTTFAVNVDLTTTKEEARAAAIEIARSVMGKCD